MKPPSSSLDPERVAFIAAALPESTFLLLPPRVRKMKAQEKKMAVGSNQRSISNMLASGPGWNIQLRCGLEESYVNKLATT
ncbi:hypothetical protein N7456_005467 [Penicillium angulare]|uniref:Uncharacterized protein n=1 Tax=Penicillium angulare TaxID=116970 RepID=A0A9W9FYJ9_9EURO|nr:hypothetical protein N7456_005467 [Penicillium angulare]